MSLTHVADITLETLIPQVAVKKFYGHRLVTLTVLGAGDGLEVLYHFDKDYQLSHLRLRLEPGQGLPSISGLYPAAALVENEAKDLFGLAVSNLALDYKGRLLLTEDAPQAPMRRVPGIGLDARRAPPAAGATAPPAEGAAP